MKLSRVIVDNHESRKAGECILQRKKSLVYFDLVPFLDIVGRFPQFEGG
jgi:hypothetical protein